MKKFMKISIALVFVFAGVILFANLNNFNSDDDFKNLGENAIATILDIRANDQFEADQEFPYALDVQFYIQDLSSPDLALQKGKFIKTSIAVKSKDLFKFRKGYKEKIVYIKNDPTTATLNEYIN